MQTKQIKLKTVNEVDILRKAGKILASIIREVSCSLKSGMTTKDIDRLVEESIKRHGVKAAFKGYRGFPGHSCISVNEVVVHGIPGQRVIAQGDIISLDIGIIYQGYYSDSATTIPIGKVTPEVERLLTVTDQALGKAIEQCRAGNHLGDISFAVQSFVELHGFSVVRDFVGHGIGRQLHEEPEIPNYGKAGSGPVLKPGMVFAIEPMVNMGQHQTKILSDGWTVVTADGKPSAHFEHCVLITDNNPEILTI